MTDPFADLERELLAAHARDRGPRRRLRAAGRPLAVAGSILVAAAAFAWLGGIAPGEPERPASQLEEGWTEYGPPPARDPDADTRDQPGVTAVDGCAGAGWVAPQSDEPVPAAIKEQMGVFEAPARDVDPPDRHMTGRQASKLYADGHRALPPVPAPAHSVHMLAAEILPRAQVDRQDDLCAAPRGELEPGVCLVLTHDKGAMSACFTIGEILQGAAYLDTDDELIGIAPDGFARARAGDASAEIADNVFRIPQPERWDMSRRVAFERS